MHQNKIGFLGEGWGAVAAVKSLNAFFEIECFSSDSNVLAEVGKNSKIVNSLDEFSATVLLCAGYKPVIKTQILDKHTVINIHYSLLPSYRGLHSTAWAIMNGEHKLGLTIHLMNEYIDDGPIIHQKEFLNDQISTAAHYMKLMNQYIEDNCGEVVLQFVQGKITPIIQDKSKASWVGKRDESHNLINFYKNFESCQRLFRILQHPYPSPKIRYKGILYNIGEVKFQPSNVETDLSRILNNDNEGVWVKSSDGYFILKGVTTSQGESVNQNIFKIGSYINV